MNKSKIKYYCKKCKTSKINYQTALYGTSLCHKCASKKIVHNKNCHCVICSDKIGKKNGNFKHGECNKKHYCKNCKTEISITSFLYGTGRCLSCAMKKFARKDKNHKSYIHGKYSKNFHNHCKCGKEISPFSKKCQSCAKMGKGSPSYIDGNSNAPYPPEFNRILKESIRDRDNHKCQDCSKTETELDETLAVHHIDYNKQNCNDENLISLCNSCHTKTNTNRDFWFAYYTYKIQAMLSLI